MNRDLVERLRSNPMLLNVTRHLGKMREIFTTCKRNSYAYGLGEKYSLEQGNQLSQVLSSEYALLALAETQPLFYRKYQHKQLKQYKRRQPIYKGSGDIIFCKDESGSMEGENHAWASALALTMLQIAASEKRRFALIHFASGGQFKTDMFEPGRYTLEDMIQSAELFLNGGTDYDTPIKEAKRLIQDEGFGDADVIFATDGACSLSQDSTEMLDELKLQRKLKLTGLLLDADDHFSFSLAEFCDSVLRLSELTKQQATTNLIQLRVLKQRSPEFSGDRCFNTREDIASIMLCAVLDNFIIFCLTITFRLIMPFHFISEWVSFDYSRFSFRASIFLNLCDEFI